MLGFLFVPNDGVEVDPDAQKVLKDDAGEILDRSIAALEARDNLDPTEVQHDLRAILVDEMGVKPRLAFAPLRVAITGRRVSPPLFESMEILGKEASLTRLRKLRAAL